MESNRNSSSNDSDDDVDINLPNINNDHLVENPVLNIGNDTSTSAAPGVTVITSIRPQSHHHILVMMLLVNIVLLTKFLCLTVEHIGITL